MVPMSVLPVAHGAKLRGSLEQCDGIDRCGGWRWRHPAEFGSVASVDAEPDHRAMSDPSPRMNSSTLGEEHPDSGAYRCLTAPRIARVAWRTLVGSIGFALLSGGCDDWVTESTPVSVSVQIAGAWLDYMLLSDVDTVEFFLADDNGDRVRPIPIAVESSDERVVSVVQLPWDAADSTVRVVVEAIGVGVAEVTAELSESGAFPRRELSRAVTVHMKWRSVGAGDEHSCGVTYDGGGWCWGGGTRFLGDGASVRSLVPSRVVGAYSFGAISAGWAHSCGTLVGGLALCWGQNPTGALGTGSVDDQLAPVTTRFSATFRRLRAGHQYTCGLTVIDKAMCWGDNGSGQLGAVTAVDDCGGEPCSLSPVPVQSAAQLDAGSLPDFRDVSAGHATTCGISMIEGHVLCWGDNAYGMLGTDAVTRSDSARVVSDQIEFSVLSTGRYHACALTPTGRAFCWGTNRFGELGTDAASEHCSGLPCSRAPLPVTGALLFASIHVGENTTCAVHVEGGAYCWGLGHDGQLGSASTERCSGLICARRPRAVDIGSAFRTVSVGKRHACGVTVRGGAFCWGQGSEGKLGYGAIEDRNLPTRVADPG